MNNLVFFYHFLLEFSRFFTYISKKHPIILIAILTYTIVGAYILKKKQL